MARIRTVKPDFFRHEGLQDLEIAHPGKYTMLVFEGLWGHCDKAGRFEWRPRTLKLDILPFLPFEMAETLAALADAGFIHRYSVDGKEYGEIKTFAEHQRLGGKELQEPAKHPAPIGEVSKKESGSNGEATGKHLPAQEGKGKEGKGERASDRASPPEKPGDVDDSTWRDWLALRKAKRAPVTETVLKTAVAEAGKAGMTLEAFLQTWCARGSQGLEASWLKPNERAGPASRQPESPSPAASRPL